MKARQKYSGDAVPTYIYRFDFDSKSLNMMRRLSCGRKIRGTCHADDIMYVFYNAGVQKPQKDTMEYLTIRRLIYILTQFARYGSPTYIIQTDWNKNEKEINLVNSSSTKNILISNKSQEIKESSMENVQMESNTTIDFKKLTSFLRDDGELLNWLPVPKDTDLLECLNISEDLNVINLPELEKLKFWDMMYEDKSLLY